MPLFNRKPKTNNQYNRFASHTDVLQCMARALSKRVIERIQDFIKYHNSANGVFEFNLRINIQDSNYERNKRYHCYSYAPDTSFEVDLIGQHYCLPFGNFGMESIASSGWNQFMDALYPHFETIFKDQFSQAVSDKNCSVNVFRSNYSTEDFDYDDKLIKFIYPSIEISFKGGKEVERPTLKRW